jgi:hypothetical protein
VERRFGISESVFDEYLLFKRKRSWWLLRNTPLLQSASRFKVASIGLRAFQQVGKYVKPSTRMIQMFGHLATKASVEMDEVQLHKLVGGDPVNAYWALGSSSMEGSIHKSLVKNSVFLEKEGNAIQRI